MKRPRRSLWGILGGLTLVAAVPLSWHAATHGRTPAIRDGDGRELPGSVTWLGTVTLGGVPQSVLVRGRDVSNPVLLMLHGGPGMPQMYLAHAYQRALEGDFTVVQWDRRGAGKSFDPSLSPASLSTERLLQDAVDLVRWLKEGYPGRPIVLVGHSWGTYLGVLLVKAHPEMFQAYVGIGQLAAFGERMRLVQDRWIVAEAGRRGEPARADDLRRDPSARERLLFRYGAEVRGMTNWWPLLWSGLEAPEYTLLDVIRLVRGLNLYSRAHFDEEDLLVVAPSLPIPVYFFTGRHDYVDPFELTQEYFDRVEAPYKELVWFEDSAHFPFLEEPDLFALHLRRVRARVVR